MSPLPPVSRLDLDHVLDHTRDLWDELRGQRVFITGGTGFFGCWLLESFTWAVDQLGLNTQAFVLTRSPDAFYQKVPHLAEHKSVTLIQGDIRNFDFPEGEFSHVIHAATESSAKLNAEFPLLMLDTIVEGTRRTLEFASFHGTKKLLLTSSGAVYGKQPPEMTHIPENYSGAPDPLVPISTYGQGKRLAEHLCTLYAQTSSVEMKIARCFAFVGPYLPLDAHFAIGNFIRDAMKGGPIVIKGDGTPYRSYLYGADLAIWLWTILFNGQHLYPYNVGSAEALSVLEVAQNIASQFDEQLQLEILGKQSRKTVKEQYIPSIIRVNRDLQLQVWISIQKGISLTLQYLGRG